ncbi:four helix bundle protein [Candidatus Synechococcus calcipolaris]
MGRNIVKDKSFDFAVRIVNLSKYLTEQKREYVLSRQILRSGTAVGALIREAEQAESKADFIHKLAIALKEANETDYWLDLLYKTEYLEDKHHQSLKAYLTELLKLLTSIIKTINYHLPQTLNLVDIKLRINTHNWQSHDVALGDQQPIKRIAMVRRQTTEGIDIR